VHILLVEDNPGDVRLIQEVLKDSNISHVMSVVPDGEAAVNFLKRAVGFESSVRPDLILLDLNLPKKDGRQVLEEIKTDTDLRAIPVVVLTTSQAEQDVAMAYSLHANCYIQKPVDLDQFWMIVMAIEEFWLTTVSLPQPHTPS
jgi:CheY-like chemotaxis protein